MVFIRAFWIQFGFCDDDDDADDDVASDKGIDDTYLHRTPREGMSPSS
jgi:hypothetical protein